MRATLLLPFLIFAACKKEQMSPATCEFEAHRFGNWLKALPKQSNLQPPIPVPAITAGKEPAPFVHAHYIVIDKKSVSLQGDVLAEAGGSFDGFAEDLAEALNMRNEQRGLMGEAAFFDVALAIAPDAPWSLVAPTLNALGAVGQNKVMLVFERKGMVRPPPRSSVTAKIEKILADADPSQKATEMARVIEGVVKDCPAAQRRLGEVAMMAPDGRDEFIRLEIPKAFIECQCRVDLEAAQTAFHALVAPRVGVVTTDVRIGPAGAPVALPAATPWSEAHAKVIASPDEPHSFVVQ